MHPDSKDYTQRVIAGSILLDGALFELAENFLSVNLNEEED